MNMKIKKIFVSFSLLSGKDVNWERILLFKFKLQNFFCFACENLLLEGILAIKIDFLLVSWKNESVIQSCFSESQACNRSAI